MDPTGLLNACTSGAVARSLIIISGLIRSLVGSEYPVRPVQGGGSMKTHRLLQTDETI